MAPFPAHQSSKVMPVAGDMLPATIAHLNHCYVTDQFCEGFGVVRFAVVNVFPEAANVAKCGGVCAASKRLLSPYNMGCR
ncbi:hypothetical protein N9Z87_00385 [Amylibacter sp.]|nr:hypothetical protein [Amylibacter sp.]